MKVDLSRYQECPNCHTFQVNLQPCRKCGWHQIYQKKVPIPSHGNIYASVSKSGPKPKPGYKRKKLALLRALEDGDYHPAVDLIKEGVIGRWAPTYFCWQGELVGQGIIDYGKESLHSKRYCLWITPDRMQDAKKLMAELEDIEDGEDERGETEL